MFNFEYYFIKNLIDKDLEITQKKYGNDISIIFRKEDIFDAAKNGDAVAKQIAERYGYYLGKGIALTASVVNPEIIVIGGGVSKAGEILFDLLKPSFEKYVFPGCKDAKFALAKLGNDAGVYGAAKMLLY